MIDFIGYLVVGSVWCFGVYAIFDSRHLLGRLSAWIEENTSVTFCRPLFGCPTCMASVHGAILGFALFGLSWAIPAYMICLCGMNFIIVNVIENEL